MRWLVIVVTASWVVSSAVLGTLLGREQERVESLRAELAGRCPPADGERMPVEGVGPRDPGPRVTLSEADLDRLAQRVAAVLKPGPEAGPVSQPARAEPSTPPPVLTTGQQAALERASALVAAVLRRGQMSVEDVKELRERFREVGAREELRPLLTQLVVAINQQRVRPPDDPRYLFP